METTDNTMLRDFIEANNLKARILPHRGKSNLIKCRLFLADGESALYVALSGKKTGLESIKKELKCSALEIPDGKKTLQITGYRKEFLPPISIYGVRLLLDKTLLAMGILHCNISEETSLEITAEEILRSNEEI